MAICRGLLWVPAWIALSAQAPDPALLPHIREHMQHRLSAVPNYTCRETVERAERRSNRREYRVIDTMVLEVAEVAGRELLAWPGGRFEAQPLSAFASSGLMTNGAFAMHARGLFFGDRASWKYLGERNEGGRKLVMFGFAVPLNQSGYRVKSASASAVIPYHGTLMVDPESLDAVRIEVFSDSIAKEIGMERVDMVIEYQRVQIGSTDALLPKSADVLTTLRRNKLRQRNRITFSGCRQYGSESVISFIDGNVPAPAAQSPAANSAPLAVLPEGARVVLRLASPLNSANTPVGTPVQAIVDGDVLDGERLVMPKGARVSGRVRTLARVRDQTPAFQVGLEFTSAQWDGGQAYFAAELEEVEEASGAQLTLSAFTDESTDPSPVGTFYVRGKAFSLYQGFRTVWKILPASGAGR
jgi:hypothetical protein